MPSSGRELDDLACLALVITVLLLITIASFIQKRRMHLVRAEARTANESMTEHSAACYL
jgi:hypothetical protein